MSINAPFSLFTLLLLCTCAGCENGTQAIRSDNEIASQLDDVPLIAVWSINREPRDVATAVTLHYAAWTDGTVLFCRPWGETFDLKTGSLSEQQVQRQLSALAAAGLFEEHIGSRSLGVDTYIVARYRGDVGFLLVNMTIEGYKYLQDYADYQSPLSPKEQRILDTVLTFETPSISRDVEPGEDDPSSFRGYQLEQPWKTSWLGSLDPWYGNE